MFCCTMILYYLPSESHHNTLFIHASIAHWNTKAMLQFAASIRMEEHGLACVAGKMFSIN